MISYSSISNPSAEPELGMLIVFYKNFLTGRNTNFIGDSDSLIISEQNMARFKVVWKMVLKNPR